MSAHVLHERENYTGSALKVSEINSTTKDKRKSSLKYLKLNFVLVTSLIEDGTDIKIFDISAVKEHAFLLFKLYQISHKESKTMPPLPDKT